ncbi:MAG: SsrA-binding protein SmpB [Simkaniaceae bacterium]|nr:SsrA-binding protein SmpB [Simkaniaceae bacterium]
MSKKPDNELVNNRVALRNYEILETVEAGISLVGTEIKSLRDHGGNLRDAYVIFDSGEAFLKECSIAPYRFGNVHNHEERRLRKLLLHKYEIRKFEKECQLKGATVIPLAMYLKHGMVKVKLALARGRKLHDKREAIKAKEVKREISKRMKEKS